MSLQGFLKESLGCDRVSLSGKPKVDCGAAGIDGTIEVPPASALANVRFVNSNCNGLACGIAPAGRFLESAGVHAGGELRDPVTRLSDIPR